MHINLLKNKCFEFWVLQRFSTQGSSDTSLTGFHVAAPYGPRWVFTLWWPRRSKTLRRRGWQKIWRDQCGRQGLKAQRVHIILSRKYGFTCSCIIFCWGPQPATELDFQVGSELFDGGTPRLTKPPHDRTFWFFSISTASWHYASCKLNIEEMEFLIEDHARATIKFPSLTLL